MILLGPKFSRPLFDAGVPRICTRVYDLFFFVTALFNIHLDGGLF